MASDKIEELVKLRSTYQRGLGEIFHHKSASDLAGLYFNKQLSGLVTDYVQMCLPNFREEYEQAKSQLEQTTQNLQTPEESLKERIDAGFSECRGRIDSSQSNPMLTDSQRKPRGTTPPEEDDMYDAFGGSPGGASTLHFS